MSVTKLTKITAALTVLFLVPMFAIRAQPAGHDDLAVLLAPPDGCEIPCFLGIRPGKSTVSEALAVLRNHEWISQPRMSAPGNGFSVISWQWSGLQPALINDDYPGRLTFYWDEEDPSTLSPEEARVETISLHTWVRMYKAQAWYGEPDSGTANYYPEEDIRYTAAYHQPTGMVQLATVMNCPVNWLTYWDSHTRIQFSIGHGISTFVPPETMVNFC